MIQVQLWKHNALLNLETVDDGATAERLIDRLINDVATGRHGAGRYKIDADYVDKNGLFVGSFHNGPWFAYPVAERAAA